MRKILSLFIVALFSASMWATTAYFVNVTGWEKVNMYMWQSSNENNENAGWPGAAMTKTEIKINGYSFDVYSYDVNDEASYDKAIFNNGSAQTHNLDWDKGKPCFFPTDHNGDPDRYWSKWYLSPEDVPDPTAGVFYISGISAEGVAESWGPKQVKVTGTNEYTFSGLTAGSYSLKVLSTGSWTSGSNYGYDNLTATNIGLYKDAAGDVCFDMAATGNVKVTFAMDGDNVTTFTVTGDYYLPVTKTIKIVPWKWAAKDAKIAAQIKGTKLVGEQWTPFFSGSDTLSVAVSERADSIKFVRFSPDATEPSWSQPNWNNIGFLLIDNVGLTYTIKDWWEGTWESYQPSYVITGAGSSYLKDVTLKNADNKLTATGTITLDKGNYNFYVVKDNSSWFRKNNGSESFVLHRDYPGVAGVTDWEGESMQLTVDMTGTYTFNWTFGNDSLGIDFPALPDPAYYLTIGPSADASGWTNHAMTEDAGVWSVATDVVKTITNCQFKIFKNWPETDKDNVYYGAENYENEMTASTGENPWTLSSPGHNINITPNDKSGNYTFRFTPEGNQLDVVYPSGTVAIDNTEASTKAVKRIVNGQLVIEREGKTFNALGVEVK